MLVDLMNRQTYLHDVTLLVINDEVDDGLLARVSEKVKICRFGRKPGSNPLKLMLRLNMFILRRNPDVIHLHSHKLSGLVKVMNSRVLFTVHDLGIPMTYLSGRQMCAISEAVRVDVKSREPKARIVTVYNGIETSDIKYNNHRHISPDTFRIVNVGRLEPDKKGQDILIQALGILLKRGRAAEVTFIGDGSGRECLKRMAEEYGLAERVTFTGSLSRAEIYSSLCDYDIMCHPARYEGFGLTVAEGMTAGLPLVIPEGGGPWEVAANGKFAHTFRNSDAADCASAIEDVMDNYEQACATAEAARHYAISNYSMDAMDNNYDRIYIAIISRNFPQ